MGVAGWRFAHGKRNLSGRAAIVAVLEDWPVICSVVVVVGSMIMIGIMSSWKSPGLPVPAKRQRRTNRISWLGGHWLTH